MTAQTVIADLSAYGITPRLTPDGQHLAFPSGRLTPEQRDLVLAHKAELIAFLIDARATTARLIEVAMHACDFYGDGEAARELMRLDCIDTPAHLQPDLMTHFTRAYGAYDLRSRQLLHDLEKSGRLQNG